MLGSDSGQGKLFLFKTLQQALKKKTAMSNSLEKSMNKHTLVWAW